jgi:flagellar basal body-associated protein FliL
MADEKTKEKQEDSKEPTASKTGILPWIILAAVVLLCAGGGFLLGRLLAASSITGAAQASEENEAGQPAPQADNETSKTGKTWFHNLEPVVANLNEPGATRYARATLTLEITPDASQKEAAKIFDEKTPLLTNWLTIYLSSLSIEDIRGDKNLKRMQLQILDAFNEELFPNQKPKIKQVLFKEFAVQ